MSCKLCLAIAAGMPITDDTPLPCRLRPTSHDPLPEDPWHGAVFDPPPGQKTFDEAFIKQLNDHHAATTAEQRVAAHAPHLHAAREHLRARETIDSLNPHPLDALKGT